MSEQPKKPNVIPNSLIELFVHDILQKNGITKKEVKDKISEEKKQAIKELVEDLSRQVESFVNTASNHDNDSTTKK